LESTGNIAAPSTQQSTELPSSNDTQHETDLIDSIASSTAPIIVSNSVPIDKLQVCFQ